jgi:hypothetical protein
VSSKNLKVGIELSQGAYRSRKARTEWRVIRNLANRGYKNRGQTHIPVPQLTQISGYALQKRSSRRDPRWMPEYRSFDQLGSAHA